MKKIFFLLALVATTGGGLRAQDTLYQEAAPLSYYFYNNWIDTTHVLRDWGGIGSRAYITAKRFITDDTLRIYGIAAMMMCPEAYYTHNPDTIPILKECRESLLLFQYHGPDSLPTLIQLGDSLSVHCVETPVAYWMRGSYRSSRHDTLPLPVYERYFVEPQQVFDTFYAGFTQGDFYYDDSLRRYVQTRPKFEVLAFAIGGGSLYIGYDECDARLMQSPPRDLSMRWFYGCHQLYAPFIFPILTPEPPADTTVTPVDTTVTPIDTTVIPIDTTVIPVDTTINPGDTTAVVSPEVMRRYVAVQPNPAHERVAVTSSFGLTAIEAYDSRGRQLFSAPASGFKVTLDISAWPRGTYLLRILTPLGPTTRKVIVQ